MRGPVLFLLVIQTGRFDVDLLHSFLDAGDLIFQCAGNGLGVLDGADQIGRGNGRSALDKGTFNGILDHSFQVCAIVAFCFFDKCNGINVLIPLFALFK